MACLAWKLQSRQHAAQLPASEIHSRALLSREALEQHLGVAVDAEVLDGLGVLRGARRILPGRSLGERRAHGLTDGLHRDGEVATRAKRGGVECGYRGAWSVVLRLVLANRKLRHGGSSSASLANLRCPGQRPSAPDNLTKIPRGITESRHTVGGRN